MSTRKPSLVLAALERTLGVDFVEQLYADFLATDAFATYTYHKSLLKGAYDAVRTAPDFAAEVLMAGDVYLSPGAQRAAMADLQSFED